MYNHREVSSYNDPLFPGDFQTVEYYTLTPRRVAVLYWHNYGFLADLANWTTTDDSYDADDIPPGWPRPIWWT